MYYTHTIGAINNNSTQAQIRRIIAITYAANFFFVCRVGIEISFLVALIILTISKCILDVYVCILYVRVCVYSICVCMGIVYCCICFLNVLLHVYI